MKVFCLLLKKVFDIKIENWRFTFEVSNMKTCDGILFFRFKKPLTCFGKEVKSLHPQTVYWNRGKNIYAQRIIPVAKEQGTYIAIGECWKISDYRTEEQSKNAVARQRKEDGIKIVISNGAINNVK